MVASTRSFLLASVVAFIAVPWAVAADAPATQPAPAAKIAVQSISATAVPARRALAMNIAELNVDNIPLSRVLDYLRDVSGANIVVNWRVLEAANVTKDTPVTIAVNNVPLRKVLRLVLDQASPATTLVFPVDSNVIGITSQEEADKVLLTRVYVVNDLVMTPNNPGPVPQMDLQTITANGNVQAGGGGVGTTGGGCSPRPPSPPRIRIRRRNAGKTSSNSSRRWSVRPSGVIMGAPPRSSTSAASSW